MELISVKILLLLFGAAFLVGIINATFGVGGSLLAYPLLAYWLEGKTIIGVLSIIVIVATAHRLILYRQHLSPKAIKYFLVLGIPFSVAGAFGLAKISVGMLQIIVGVFLIGMAVHEWILDGKSLEVKTAGRSIELPKYFIGIGAVSGFLTGLIGSAGFINTAFLLRVGFVKEGVSVNQAGIALAYSLIKLPVYWENEIITPAVLLAGAAGSTGSLMGTFLGSRLLKHITISRFVFILRIVIIMGGAHLIFAGL